MAHVDALKLAAANYVTAVWGEREWRQFGLATGTDDILNDHPRLYRSLSFNDDDYPQAVQSVLDRLLSEAVESPGERGRIKLIAEAIPQLPQWVMKNAPSRVQRLFFAYLDARAVNEIPFDWAEYWYGEGDVEAEEQEPPPPCERPTPQQPKEPYASEPQAQVATLLPTAQASTPTPQNLQPSPPKTTSAAQNDDERKIFIVHGHDEVALNAVRQLVYTLTRKMPISLAEEPGGGKTVIEKFEQIGGSASFAIVLLTPDDVGQTVAAHEAGETPLRRARQNVILELGYFVGKLGRENVLMVNGGVEQPSDINGVSYVAYPGTDWKHNLRVEIEGAGLLKGTRG